MATYKVFTLDVWGNEEDGWDVNDIRDSGRTVDIPDDADTARIGATLFTAGLTTRPDGCDVDDSEPSRLVVSQASNGCPVFFLDSVE